MALDFSKNEGGPCTAKWANDNTLDVDVGTLPDYFINVVAPANTEHYGLAVDTTGEYKNSNTFDRNARCSRGTIQKVCTISVGWHPWPGATPKARS